MLTLVNAKFKEFGTKPNCQLLFKVLMFDLTDVIEPTILCTIGGDSPLIDNTQNYSNDCQVSEKQACLTRFPSYLERVKSRFRPAD